MPSSSNLFLSVFRIGACGTWRSRKHGVACRRRAIVPLLLVAALLALTACGGDGTTRAERAARQGIALVGNGAEPADLDPHVVTGHPEIVILRALFEGLVSLDPQTLDPAPGAAESWDISDDGLVHTFHLRPEARWSNGAPVTAHDFVYGWRRALSPELAGQYAYLLYCVENARAFFEGRTDDPEALGVRALDDYTFEVRLDRPTPHFLSMLIMPISFPVLAEAVEAHGTMTERHTRWTRPGNLVSNGAFMLTDWKPDRLLEVSRNPHYWDADAVRLSKVHFFPIGSAQTEERLFRTGGLHITSTVPPHKIEVYREAGDERLHMDPYLGTYYLKVNVTRPPFDDARVRLAFAMSIDRESICRYVTRGGQMPADSFVPPGTAGYISRNGIPFDPEGARRLLALAGYPDGKGFPEGVELLYNTSESHRQVAEAVQDMWKTNLGIRVGLINQDWKVYLANLHNLDYYIARAGWIGDYVDPSNFLECFLSESGNNNTGYASEEFDNLMARASSTLDRYERFDLFQEAEGVLMKDCPLAPIYTYTRITLVSPLLRGREPNLLDHVFFKDWYFLNQESLGGSSAYAALPSNFR